jgi:hypothetical protein
MCWFFKKRKKRKEEENLAKEAKKREILEENSDDMKLQTTPEEEQAKTRDLDKILDVNDIEIGGDLEQEIENIENQDQNQEKESEISEPKAQVFAWPKTEKVEESLDKKEVIEKKPKESKAKYTGKYEVYPEAGFFKFRLKASNGEILAVSFRYSTEKGALSGIETFKKNVETGIFEVVTDKSNFSVFNLFNATGARVIISGEFYNNFKQAQSAVESVKKFYSTNRIEILSSIHESDIREENVELEPVENSLNGKYEIYNEANLYFVRLKANNAQVLFVSQGYSSKASAKSGLQTIQKAIDDDRFSVANDKLGRFRFNLYSSTNQLILSGETYPVKSSCISAINSVRKFSKKAKVAEL